MDFPVGIPVEVSNLQHLHSETFHTSGPCSGSNCVTCAACWSLWARDLTRRSSEPAGAG